MKKHMYNQDEELLLAFINKNKIEKEIKDFGYNNYQVKKESDKIYSLSRRKYALEFLRLNKANLDALSQFDVANILQALLCGGGYIEDEEICSLLEVLENQVTHRISNYILLSETHEETDSNGRFSNSKKKFIKKTIEFSNDDIESFLCMLISMKIVLQNKKIPEDENKEHRRNIEKIKYAEMVEKIIKKDLETRQEQEEIEKAQKAKLEKDKDSKKKKKFAKQKNKSR